MEAEVVQPMYLVEEILGRKIIQGNVLYKIKWKDYPMSQCTWEPLSNLDSIKGMIDAYNFSHPLSAPNTVKDKPLLKRKNKRANDGEIEANIMNTTSTKKQPGKKNINSSNKNTSKTTRNKQLFEADSNYKTVTNVIMDNENKKLMAVIKNRKGQEVYMSTEELKYKNPFGLLKFYESKIKFT